MVCLAYFIKSNHSKHKEVSLSFFNIKKMQEAHRRRIKTKEKAKVVAAVWRTELIQFVPR